MTTTAARTDAAPRRTGPERALLVGSAGGHLAQLLALRAWWEARDRTWVTFDTADATSRLVGEDVVIAHRPTTRNVPNLIRNGILALRVIWSRRPDVIVSTGAGVALPFFAVGRVLGVPTVYIEVVDRVASRTLTGKLCYRIANRFVVQWTEQERLYPGAAVVGPLI